MCFVFSPIFLSLPFSPFLFFLPLPFFLPFFCSPHLILWPPAWFSFIGSRRLRLRRDIDDHSRGYPLRHLQGLHVLEGFSFARILAYLVCFDYGDLHLLLSH